MDSDRERIPVPIDTMDRERFRRDIHEPAGPRSSIKENGPLRKHSHCLAAQVAPFGRCDPSAPRQQVIRRMLSGQSLRLCRVSRAEGRQGDEVVGARGLRKS